MASTYIELMKKRRREIFRETALSYARSFMTEEEAQRIINSSTDAEIYEFMGSIMQTTTPDDVEPSDAA